MSSAATLSADRLLVLHEIGHACVAALCGYETQIAPETELGTGVWNPELGETLAARPIDVTGDFPFVAFALGGGVAQKAFECPHLSLETIVGDALRDPATLRGFASDQDLWVLSLAGPLALRQMTRKHRIALIGAGAMIRKGGADDLIDWATARLLAKGSCVIEPQHIAA